MTMQVRTTTAGAISLLEADGLSLIQYPATEFEAGPANLWLRTGESVRPLTGPACGGEVLDGPSAPVVRVELDGLQAHSWLATSEDGQLAGWHWQVTNPGQAATSFDLVCTLDLALTPLADVRRSEAYVSQYLDLTPVIWSGGLALGVRQNMPGQRQPWCALASSEPVAGWCTDALQVAGSAGAGLDLSKDLPSKRLQHEHTLAGLQTERLVLAPGETRSGVFWIIPLADHPQATGPADAAVIEHSVAGAEWPSVEVSGRTGHAVVATLFSPALVAEAEPIDVVTDDLAFVENGPDGQFWSAFRADDLVVAAGKERAVLRPHGAVLHFAPDARAHEDHLANTVWMAGVFSSQLTLGPASSGERLTIRRSYLGLASASGLRLFVRRPNGPWHLLGTPSLWSAGSTHSEWLYQLTGDLAGAQVRVAVDLSSNHKVGLAASSSGGLELLAVLFEDHAGVELDPSGRPIGDDAVLFADGASRGCRVRSVHALDGSLELSLLLASGPGAQETHDWRVPQLVGPESAALLGRFLRNLVADAAVHYQTPRGLEQYTGGAWGTRDVCQGPVGLLLSTGELDALRETLIMVFAGQQEDGSWPQWFHFLPSAVQPGFQDSHGDVVYWPLLALGEYLERTGDLTILDAEASFVGRDEITAASPLRDHVQRALAVIRARRTRDERLPAYGHGDWNDSLQPARSELAEQMCSTWTTELEIQSLECLAHGLGEAWPEMSAELLEITARTRVAFDEVLLGDGELAGYALMEQDGTELIVHPRDQRTGLRHGLLQMIHAISDELLTPEDLAQHLQIIEQDLVGPCGAYLFNAPVAYSGGVMHDFKRAEAATFWGREIGLMYTHSHLRWVEALTHAGRAQQAWEELCKIIPIGLTQRVPGAAPRQLNCYFSSSDAAFDDRYQAVEQASELFDPNTRFEGGWRVYSSGPGLVLRTVTERLLGVRASHRELVIDPVLPAAFDGLGATVALGERDLHLTYHVGGRGHGVQRLRVGETELPLRTVPARYRPGGVALDWTQLPTGTLEIEVWLD